MSPRTIAKFAIGPFGGAKVFLDKKNPVYDYFKKNNAHIYTIQNIEHEINLPLSDD
jgi:hypothetical protein